MTTGRDTEIRDFKHVTVSSLSTLMFSVTCEKLYSWVRRFSCVRYCTLRFDRWRRDGSLAHVLHLFVDASTQLTRIACILICDSKHWLDIVSGRYVVLWVLIFATVRSNVNLENLSLVKSFEKSSCKVKEGERIVLFVAFQLTLTQDVVPDDLCTHDMSTVITRLYTIVESLHQFHPIDVFLMSSCLRLIHFKDSDDHIRRIRSHCWRWCRKNILGIIFLRG